MSILQSKTGLMFQNHQTYMPQLAGDDHYWGILKFDVPTEKGLPVSVWNLCVLQKSTSFLSKPEAKRIVSSVPIPEFFDGMSSAQFHAFVYDALRDLPDDVFSSRVKTQKIRKSKHIHGELRLG